MSTHVASSHSTMSERKARARKSLSHVVHSAGRSQSVMVDVGAKAITARSATARATVVFPRGLLSKVLAQGGPKGPIVEVARVAGIQAAKRTPEWIPMCHIVPLDLVEISVAPRGSRTLEITCRAACQGRTGVEMEALVGASACALVVYDMTKALSHEIAIERVELVEKSGGKSGPWRRAAGARRRA